MVSIVLAFTARRFTSLLEIARRRSVVAIPIFDGSILGFQKTQKAAIGTVPEMMAASFYGVAWFDVIHRNSYSLKPGPAGCLQGPHLRFALGVLDFQVDPGMRHH